MLNLILLLMKTSITSSKTTRHGCVWTSPRGAKIPTEIRFYKNYKEIMENYTDILRQLDADEQEEMRKYDMRTSMKTDMAAKTIPIHNDSVYHVYECCPDTESRIELYEQILGEKLTWQEKQELRIKHQIDLL